MLICDLCKKEIIGKRGSVNKDFYTEYACGAWQFTNYDICENCYSQYKELLIRTEAEFVKNKILLSRSK